MHWTFVWEREICCFSGWSGLPCEVWSCCSYFCFHEEKQPKDDTDTRSREKVKELKRSSAGAMIKPSLRFFLLQDFFVTWINKFPLLSKLVWVSCFMHWTFYCIVYVVVVQLLSHVQLLATPLTAACQAPLSFTISWSLLQFMSTELVMLSNHLILCHHLLLLPSLFPSIRVFSSELVLRIRWPKCWSFSFSLSPSTALYIYISYDLGFYGNWDWISLSLIGVNRV